MEFRIIKRGNKSVGIISYKDSITGNHKQKWITAQKHETDQQLKRRILDWIDDYESNDVHNNGKVTFGAFIKQWIETRDKIAITTRNEYYGYIKKHIIPNLGHIKLAKLKTVDIDKFYKKLSNSTYKKGSQEIKYSNNTILQIHAIIHKCLNYAKHNKIIKDNPATYCENKPERERYKGEVYTVEQFTSLLSLVKDTIDEIYIILAGCLGLRRGEVMGLKWEDIDFQEKIIHIRRTKVKAGKHGIIEKEPKNKTSIRSISVNQRTIDILRAWRKKNLDSVYVVNKYNPNTYSEHFKRLLEKHGLPHTRFHDLRHFAATFMLKEGISDKVTSERLGHSSTVTTREIYQHVLEEMDREAAAKLDKLMG
jgi:integrase